MTMLATGYKTKGDLKKSIGKRLQFAETSICGPEYPDDGNGTFSVARRPHMLGGGREWFARVTVKNFLIVEVQ